MKLSKKTFKVVLIIALVAIILFWLTQLNWNNLLSRENSGALFGILAPLLIIISFQIKNKESKK